MCGEPTKQEWNGFCCILDNMEYQYAAKIATRDVKDTQFYMGFDGASQQHSLECSCGLRPAAKTSASCDASSHCINATDRSGRIVLRGALLLHCVCTYNAHLITPLRACNAISYQISSLHKATTNMKPTDMLQNYPGPRHHQMQNVTPCRMNQTWAKHQYCTVSQCNLAGT